MQRTKDFYFAYHVLVETRCRSTEVRSMLRFAKRSLEGKVIGQQIEIKRKIHFYREILSELYTSFIIKRCNDLSMRDILIDELDIVLQTKPYDWQRAKELHEKVTCFLNNNQLNWNELGTLTTKARRL